MEKKIFLGFRGPYDCSAWVQRMTIDEAVEYVNNDDIAPVFEQFPDFKKFRLEHHKGTADEDGRVFVWGEEEPSSGSGPDTQHEGYQLFIDGKLVFNNCKFVDEEDDGHVAEECEICAKPVA